MLVNDVAWWIPFSMLLWLAVREEAAGEYPRSIFRGTPRDAMANAITNHGESLLRLSEVEPLMVVFLRHSGCIFCRETLSDLNRLRAAIDETGVGLVVVHMGMPDEGDTLIDRYGLEGVDVISDPLRELYQAFHLQQGSFGQLFGPRVIVARDHRHAAGAHAWLVRGRCLADAGGIRRVARIDPARLSPYVGRRPPGLHGTCNGGV